MNDLNRALGVIARQLREEAQLSQEAMGERLGLSRLSYSNRERGDTSFTVEEVERLEAVCLELDLTATHGDVMRLVRDLDARCAVSVTDATRQREAAVLLLRYGAERESFAERRAAIAAMPAEPPSTERTRRERTESKP